MSRCSSRPERRVKNVVGSVAQSNRTVGLAVLAVQSASRPDLGSSITTTVALKSASAAVSWAHSMNSGC